MAPWLSEDELVERYRWFGGIPRFVFANESMVQTHLTAQRDAVSGLSPEQAVQIARGEFKLVDNSEDKKPSSHVLGYWSEPPFKNPTVRVISDAVLSTR